MPRSPTALEQLARDTVQIPEPLTALRALRALRQELDEIESELAGRALQASASWSQIAQALGVSKQAAHRKHRHLTEQAFSAAARGLKMPVTREALRSIQQAREEAQSLGHHAIGTEHILLGILRCRQSHAARALNALGVTHQATKACVQPTMPGVPITGSATAAVPDDGNGVSPHAQRILEGSRREALKRNEYHITVEHLLFALLTDSRNGAGQTLEALKVTPSHIRGELERQMALGSATDGGRATA
ncbi:MAG TPA: Clp protease N-terminal domain-containing protein [Solirubrobacteraceae bacterium]